MLQRVLIDREMEEISLSNDVLIKQQIIDEACEVIHLLIDDFNNMIKQIASPPTLDFSTSKVSQFISFSSQLLVPLPLLLLF